MVRSAYLTRGTMETRRDERIGQLLQALKRSDKLHLKEAATLLGVSEMTIRRDLNHKSAPVVLLGGYIVLEPRSASHYLLSDQKSRLVEENAEPLSWLRAWYKRIRRYLLTAAPPRRGSLKPLIMTFPLRRCAIHNTFTALQDKPHCRAILSGGSFTPATPFSNRLISMKR